LVTTHNNHRLILQVFRDSAKLDGLRWHANPEELQQICDILGCVPLTPLIVDHIFLQAGIQFDAIINDGRGGIVATMSMEQYNALLEKKITELGGDDGTSIIACVGKYWVLVEDLADTSDDRFGKDQAVNYGWIAKGAPRMSVTKRLRVWQNIGEAHNDLHEDPSQGIRCMWQWAVLERDGVQPGVPIHVTEVGKDPELAPLITHEKKLTVWRFPGIAVPTGVELKDGVVVRNFSSAARV
jgi:hypothetical protein